MTPVDRMAIVRASKVKRRRSGSRRLSGGRGHTFTNYGDGKLKQLADSYRPK